MGFVQNSVTISGNLTRDPEVKTFPDGGAIVRFGVAWNQSVKDQLTGQWNETPHYFDVEMRGGVGKSIAEQVRQGTPVSFTGRLVQQRWKDKTTGENRQKVLVQAFDAFVGRGKNEGGGGGQSHDDWGGAAPPGGFAGPPAGGTQFDGPPQGGQQQAPPAPQGGGWGGPPAGPPQQQGTPAPRPPAEDDIPFAFPVEPNLRETRWNDFDPGLGTA